MQTGHDQVTRQAGLNGDLGGFQVAGFSDKNLIRILPQEGTQGAGKGQTDGFVGGNLDDAFQFVFDWILNRENFGVDGIDPSEAGVEGGGFARTGGTRDDKNAVGFFHGLADVIENVFWNA